MDTSSHILIGFGLAALSQLDPVVGENTALTQAVMIGSVVGSNAPDFDILYKLKGNSSYYKNHRSHSHSLLVLPIWAVLIFVCMAPFFENISYLHLFLWIFAAVIIHVITDLLNVHGTQVLLPFNRSWMSYDILPLFDPFIFILHLVGFYFQFFQGSVAIFTSIYLIIVIYVILRLSYKHWIKHQLTTHFLHALSIKLIPTISFLKWNIIIETNDDYLFGVYHLNSLNIEHTMSKKVPFLNVLKNCQQNQCVNDFLDSTHYAFPFVEKRKNGYLVFWKDLRFRSNRFFQYLSITYLSRDGARIYSTYSGWIYSLKKFRKVIKKLKRKTSLDN